MPCGREASGVVTVFLIFFEEAEVLYYVPKAFLNATSCAARPQSFNLLSRSFSEVCSINAVGGWPA
jgi:hypothetical protein